MRKSKTILPLAVGLMILAIGPQTYAQTQKPAEAKKGDQASNLAAIDHLLTTTRTVRKRLDLTRPVDAKVIEEAINIAFQAPTGSNAQDWYFIVVADPEKKKAIADLYRKGADMYRSRPRPTYAADDPRAKQSEQIVKSSQYLYQHLHEVPVIVFAGIEGRFEKEPQFVQASKYGSILPSAWSFMLALRARGVGSAWTTLALIHEKEVAKTLAIPDNITLAVMMPVAYYKGTDFKPAKRLPAKEHTYWNTWGQHQ
ncbi:MAG TPA: nitroreductase family protein [Candidatus Binatia bacterium]|nr:nitroreductase family protein [Candidatus Binatia bacterium]